MIGKVYRHAEHKNVKKAFVEILQSVINGHPHMVLDLSLPKLLARKFDFLYLNQFSIGGSDVLQASQQFNYPSVNFFFRPQQIDANAFLGLNLKKSND